MTDTIGIIVLWLLTVTGWGLATVFGLMRFHELKDRELQEIAAKQANARAKRPFGKTTHTPANSRQKEKQNDKRTIDIH